MLAILFGGPDDLICTDFFLYLVNPSTNGDSKEPVSEPGEVKEEEATESKETSESTPPKEPSPGSKR